MKDKLLQIRKQLFDIIDDIDVTINTTEVTKKGHRAIVHGETVLAIRAGHGGIEPITGEYTTSGKQWQHPDIDIRLHGNKTFYEGVWNRTIADMLYNSLWNINIPCIKIHHEWKDERLMSQCDKINKIHRNSNPIALLFELHSNASPNHNARGFEVYTTKGETASDKWATTLYMEVEKLGIMKMRPGRSDGDPDREKDFTMITKTWCPAILPEFGFYDNSEDIRVIMDTDAMQKYVKALTITGMKAMATAK